MIGIRRAGAADMAAILDLIVELATYEEMPHGPQLTVADLRRDGGFEHGEKPLFHSFVAEIYDEKETSGHVGPLTR